MKRPIGVFDSGIGGLTVANAIKRKLPGERIIYFGDTAHLPYGDKSPDAIRYYAIRICKFLLDHDCKMVVIACHSASTVAYDTLLEFYKERIIVVNVVDPLVDAVVENKLKKVGIIATKATIKSQTYQKKIQSRDQFIEISALPTPLLVPMIEEGFAEGKISNNIIDHYLSDKVFDGIDGILLACTHYPLIKKEVAAFFNNQVMVLDSTDIVADAVDTILIEEKIKNKNREENQNHEFYVSDYTESFENTTKLFYEGDIDLQEVSFW